jgi:hypothetical protein
LSLISTRRPVFRKVPVPYAFGSRRRDSERQVYSITRSQNQSKGRSRHQPVGEMRTGVAEEPRVVVGKWNRSWARCTAMELAASKWKYQTPGRRCGQYLNPQAGLLPRRSHDRMEVSVVRGSAWSAKSCASMISDPRVRTVVSAVTRTECTVSFMSRPRAALRPRSIIGCVPILRRTSSGRSKPNGRLLYCSGGLVS